MRIFLVGCELLTETSKLIRAAVKACCTKYHIYYRWEDEPWFGVSPSHCHKCHIEFCSMHLNFKLMHFIRSHLCAHVQKVVQWSAKHSHFPSGDFMYMCMFSTCLYGFSKGLYLSLTWILATCNQPNITLTGPLTSELEFPFRCSTSSAHSINHSDGQWWRKYPGPLIRY